MKKTLLLLMAGLAVWIMSRLPHPAVDIGKLEPVELVLLTKTEQNIRVETDTGAWGEGTTLEEAVEHLKQADSKEVFLDTAEKILIRGDLNGCWQEVWTLFRPAAQVCRISGEIELTEAAAYLTMHPAGMTLGKIRAGGGNVEILMIKEGRGSIAKTG